MIDLSKMPEQEASDRSFFYGGKTYPIDFSFDNVLRWYDLLNEPNVDDYQRLSISFAMFFGPSVQLPLSAQTEAMNAIAKTLNKHAYGSADNPDPNAEPQFSYKQDSGAIYASFMQAYHIDLLKERGHMDWFRFEALLDGLPDNTQFKWIMQVRQTQIDPSKQEPEYVQNMMSLQDHYRLVDDDLKQSDKDTSHSEEVPHNNAIDAQFGALGMALLGKARKG